MLGIAALWWLDYRRWAVFSPITALAADMRRILNAPGLTLELLALGVLSNLLVVAGIYVLGVSVGLSLTVGQYLGLIPAVILCTVVPISIAGWGLRESAMVVLLGNAGISTEMALVVSVWFGLTLILAALPGGLIWLIEKPIRRGQQKAY
ncbi:MAG: lysylphosphatidylglycerol synthase domain-containing protein [Candidatus Competibacteraceae bacterium]